MRVAIKGWMVLGLLLCTMAYAVAEEITLSTMYPSPRGVYAQLRVKDGLGVGQGYLTQTAPANGVIIEGNVGIGTPTPTEKLVVDGNATTSVMIVGGGPDVGKVLTATDTAGHTKWDYPTYAP